MTPRSAHSTATFIVLAICCMFPFLWLVCATFKINLDMFRFLLVPYGPGDAETAQAMATVVGDAELITVPDVGHTPSFEEPESQRALRAIANFVREGNA